MRFQSSACVIEVVAGCGSRSGHVWRNLTYTCAEPRGGVKIPNQTNRSQQAMPSETFYCPRCRRQLTKSAQAYVLGEMMTNKDSQGFMMGDMSTPISCPGCGTAIDAQKMILGEYDGGGNSKFGCVAFVALIAVWFAIVAGLDQPWWVGLIGGILGAGLLEWLLLKITAKKSR
jgi:hypothetical protein